MTTESVTLLFTDLVGSTELSQRLLPDAADNFRRRHFATLRRALTEAGGSEVKNLGDGIMAVFASSTAALACAVAMQQDVDHDNRLSEQSVGLRVGISVGEVTSEGNDYFGDPVVEAARLCARCEGGQILASETVRLMAGRRSRFAFGSVGPLDLKGIPVPVETVEVCWEPLPADAGAAVPLPVRLAAVPRVGVVGREATLARLVGVAERVADEERCRIVLVSGEPGQGKTTLVAAAARAAFATGACVLLGHADEDVVTPYQLFAEALDHYVAHAPDEELEQQVRAHGSELSRLAPSLVLRLPNLPPSKATDLDTERFLLLTAVVGLLTELSACQPVVLVLDDLQWADGGSLLLLRQLLASEHRMRVLVLATYRPHELSHSHPLTETLAALHRNQDVTHLDLPGLDEKEVAKFLEAAAGQPLDEAGVALARAVYQETDGNPFFVEELLRHLAETGALYQDPSGRWMADDSLDDSALPHSVRVVIGARVGRLGPDTERLLSVASVIGRDFDLPVLARAKERSEDATLDLLDGARAVGLLREPAGAPGSYSFTHALIQHTLYGALGPTRRARAHGQVARALEELFGDDPDPPVAELARHWINAPQPAHLDVAVRYSRDAGDAALHSLAPDDALRHYAKAIDLCAGMADPDPVLLLDLTIGLGTAQRQIGEPAFRRTLLDAAHRAADRGDVERLVAAALANDRGFYSAVGATDAEKVAILETALELLPAGHRHRAYILATLCSELAHGTPLDRRQALADEAIAIAEATDEDAVVVWVLNHVCVPLQVPALLEVTRSRTTEALQRAERIGDPVLRFWAALWHALSSTRAGDVAEVDRCISILETATARLNQPLFSWGYAWARSMRAQIAGDVGEAEQLAIEAFRIGSESGQPDAATIFGAQINIVSGQRGTMGELVPLIEQMAAETPDIPRTFFLSVLTKAHVEGDRFDEARVLLEEFGDNAFELPLDQVWLTGMVDYADAAIECGDRRAADVLFEKLVPWRAQLPATGASVLSPVSYYLGGLAVVRERFDEAEAFFVQAAAMSERMRAKFFTARIDLAWGRMLLNKDGPQDLLTARELLTRACTLAGAHGYGTVERRALAELQRLS